jgi:hypothetical protein
MKRHFLLSLFFAAFLVQSNLQAQQVKNTGTTSDIPLKTVVIKDGNTDDAGAYLSSVNIVRFWVYKPGSTADVARILKTLRAADGVTEVEEAGVSGDYQEFVLRLKSARDKDWYRRTFAAAGLTHIQYNGGKPVELSKL